MTKVIQKIMKTPMVMMVVLMAKVKQCVQEEIDGSPPGSLCGPSERSTDEDDVDEIFDERYDGISVPLPPPS